MSEEVTEVKEITVETVKEETASPTEVEAQIAVAKAEAAVHRAEEAVAIIEQTAQLEVAQIAVEAGQAIEEHAEKVEELEYDLKWQNETIKSLQISMEQMADKILTLESKLSAPTQLADNLPPTVEIVEQPLNVDVGDHQGQQENPIVETVETVPQKAKRKIRAL